MSKLPEPEYGSLAIIGIASPPANPTVEPELRCLMPDHVSLLTTRLASSAPDARQRLIEYTERLDVALESYYGLTLDAFGFACTGSSYLLGREAELELVEAAQGQCGYPVITAARAIDRTLTSLGVKRLALIVPYPKWLRDAGHGYWESCGYSITDCASIDLGTSDTRAIYSLNSDRALEAAAGLNTGEADCVLVSGTGLPSLRALKILGAELDVPVVSSNYCLAWALLAELGIVSGSRAGLTGWESKFEQL